MCKSISGIDIPMLTISSRINETDFEIIEKKSDGSSEDEKTIRKKYIIATGRIHSGETYGSWMIQGFINFLLSDNSIAIYLREKFIFKIIPMLNPDGVIIGNYRSCICGRIYLGNDLNRKFLDPDDILNPSIISIKKLISEINENHGCRSNPIFGYFDFHSHSRKKCIFLYGVHYPLHDERYIKTRIIPKLLGERTQMFRLIY